MKNVISTDKAPAAIGPYSQAIEVNGMIYTSGVIPVVPSTGEIPGRCSRTGRSGDRQSGSTVKRGRYFYRKRSKDYRIY